MTGGKKVENTYAQKDKAGGGKPKGLERKGSREQERLKRAHVPPETVQAHWDSSGETLREQMMSHGWPETSAAAVQPLLFLTAAKEEHEVYT